jgi:hypothetical protein
MTLVEDRDSWKEAFERGEKPAGYLSEYRNKRDSNLWRSSRMVEQLCEYILYLERQVDECRSNS